MLTLLMVLLVAIASTSVFARSGGGRGHSGGRHFSSAHTGGHHFRGSRLGLGVIAVAPAFWYYPPLPYYPPVAVVPSAPPLYIEQGGEPSVPDRPAGYWYYCAEAKAYYPYVKECAGIWQPVAPQAPQAQ
ncbi:MAG TPA: hypothetical protein VIJ43_09235 [Burkholderiales bacterium]